MLYSYHCKLERDREKCAYAYIAFMTNAKEMKSYGQWYAATRSEYVKGVIQEIKTNPERMAMYSEDQRKRILKIANEDQQLTKNPKLKDLSDNRQDSKTGGAHATN